MNPETDAARIRRLLAGPAYRKLFAAVRRRLESAAGTARSVTVTGLSNDEAAALAGLLGWHRVPEGRARVVLADLDRALRHSRVGTDLPAVLEVLEGPVRDRAAERRAERAAVERMWAAAREHPAVRARPELTAWLSELRGGGLLTRAANALERPLDAVLEQVLDLLGGLPAAGVPLAVLAAGATGDPHALDDGRPLAGLVLRACVHLEDLPALPATAAGRRRLWAAVGVLCDPLSSDVLVLGLIPPGDAMLARHLRQAAAAGEPRRITLRELARQPIRVAGRRTVFVCENPSLVAAAADRLGPDCAPLVCTQGVPSVAVWELLDGLARGGVRIRFHCDFDWGGIRIANLLAARAHTSPWAYDRRHYQAAVDRIQPTTPLTGKPVPSSWDPGLTGAMQHCDRAIYEEDVLDELLGWLI